MTAGAAVIEIYRSATTSQGSWSHPAPSFLVSAVIEGVTTH